MPPSRPHHGAMPTGAMVGRRWISPTPVASTCSRIPTVEMVGSAKRAGRDQRRVVAGEVGDAVDARGLNSLGEGTRQSITT
jgi:hypothetical protein